MTPWYWRPAALIATVALLAGCASTPEALRGEFAPVEPSVAAERDRGATVRWGGRLLGVKPERERTCFEILAMPLDRSARPLASESTGRRFLACHEGFIDPVAYPERRLITVTGELSGFETRPIGGYEYRFPVLRTHAVHLWAERRDPIYDPYYPYHPYYYDPFWRHDPFYYPPRRRHRLPH